MVPFVGQLYCLVPCLSLVINLHDRLFLGSHLIYTKWMKNPTNKSPMRYSRMNMMTRGYPYTRRSGGDAISRLHVDECPQRLTFAGKGEVCDLDLRKKRGLERSVQGIE